MINIKNLTFNGLVIIISLMCLIEIIITKNVVFSTISYSIKLWINSIIPSLFPFFVLSYILISYDITNYIPVFIKNIFKRLFNTNDNVITLFFLSLLSGFPSSGKNVRLMYDNNLIDGKMASHALIFTHFSNPLFILGTVSIFFLHDEKLGIIILISHYLPNIILGIVTRNSISSHDSIIVKTNNKISFIKVFIESIRSSFDSLMLILGIITCFLIISNLISSIFKFGIYTDAVVKGLLEMTIGLKSISSINIPNIYKVVISSMILSFGGLSVHMQILSFIEDTDISYRPFFIARIYHSILSGILAYILYCIFI